MIWDKPITVGSVTVSPEHQQAAWNGWWEQGTGRGHALTRWLEFSATGERAARPRFSRHADRMLQKARKARVIRFNGRAWEPVPPETRP